MRHAMPALIFALVFVSSPVSPSVSPWAPALFSPAMAQVSQEEATDKEKKLFDPEKMLKEATRELLRTLELFFSAIPQYAPPEVLENGDIIIRRIQPKPEKRRPAPGLEEGMEKTRI
jgi:hypothetical protein